MKKNFVVQHVGYPVATVVTEDMWKDYSRHTTESAAWKSIIKATAHLEAGQWDDQYRVIALGGATLKGKNWFDAMRSEKECKKFYRKIDRSVSC